MVFSWIAETIQIERWEGTLEYTFMAPVRRSTHLLGAVAYAMVYGLIHTAAIVVAMVSSSRSSSPSANLVTIGAFMLLGSFSLVGVAMLAAILPLLFVERGMQMAFVLQSVLLLVSGVYYSIERPARLDAGHLLALARHVRPQRRAGGAHRRGRPRCPLGRHLAARS